MATTTTTTTTTTSGGSSNGVDPLLATGFHYPVKRVTYNKKDALLYAVGIGCEELCYTYENDASFAVFPTFPVVLGFKGTSNDVVPFRPSGVTIPGIPKFNPNNILHGEQSLTVVRPLPVEGGEFTMHNTLVGVYDKGKGMLMVNESELRNKQGVVYTRMLSSTFVRGMGGFGGMKQARPSAQVLVRKDRPADVVVSHQTTAGQAMLYRLSGDYNSLHADTSVAKSVGFPKPILHGLCSFAFAARAIVSSFCDHDSSRLGEIKVRFSNPVFPGETLRTEMWRVSDTEIAFQQVAVERGKVVLAMASAVVHAYGTGARL
eukprot:TRINITY_DN375_c1_g2_i1.p1 TRINITY_DN375_c1_g2~~TRINITY_DN375_c1_g2_i1.p1  ORF type:complete len:336 (-),score=70.41 TRINITY_DN375_c1_g2_i1:7-960(-)